MKDTVSSLEILELGIDYKFVEVKFLQDALTHSSYVNENAVMQESNERLEFLGDAVLELCVSNILYKMHKDVPEGILTRMRAVLVKESSLAEIALEIGLDKYIFLGKGEEIQGGRDRKSLLADTLEAVLGAIFLDADFLKVQSVIEKLFAEKLLAVGSIAPINKDYKSKLQELTQSIFKSLPIYSLLETKGAEHVRVFKVLLTVAVNDLVKESITTEGASMKKAEQNAAKEAILLLTEKYVK